MAGHTEICSLKFCIISSAFVILKIPAPCSKTEVSGRISLLVISACLTKLGGTLRYREDMIKVRLAVSTGEAIDVPELVRQLPLENPKIFVE